ncbi:MAG: hypothetical protein WD648_10355 [Planctomycetaceae bacterium]
MRTRFAGSRALDERRRRRLATGSDDNQFGNALSDVTAKLSRGGQPGGISRASMGLSFPLRKAISRRLWKIWGVGSLGLMVGAALIAASFYADRYYPILGPGFSHLFDLAGGRAIRFYGVVAFLLSGLLSVFVWWARSRSHKDFRRRYRIWSRFAGACFLFSFLIGTDAHLALNETILWFWKRGPVPPAPWSWLAPTGCCVFVFLLMLHRDMRECRASLTMLWMAALSWTAAGGMFVAGGKIPGDPLVIAMIQAGTMVFGHWCLLMSLLLHARHVVYKSAEPPSAATSRSRWHFPRIWFRKNASKVDASALADRNNKRAARQSAADAKAKSRQSTKAESPAKSSVPPTEKTTTPVAAKSTPPVAGKTNAPIVGKAGAPIAAKPSAPAAQPVKTAAAASPRAIVQPRSTPQTQTLRVDQPETETEALDNDNLKGLSKRERRKLRKQWRDGQREGQADSDDD